MTESAAAILKRLAKAPELTADARQAIQDGIAPVAPPIGVLHHTACPCIACHRFYRTVP